MGFIRSDTRSWIHGRKVNARSVCDQLGMMQFSNGLDSTNLQGWGVRLTLFANAQSRAFQSLVCPYHYPCIQSSRAVLKSTTVWPQISGAQIEGFGSQETVFLWSSVHVWSRKWLNDSSHIIVWNFRPEDRHYEETPSHEAPGLVFTLLFSSILLLLNHRFFPHIFSFSCQPFGIMSMLGIHKSSLLW